MVGAIQRSNLDIEVRCNQRLALEILRSQWRNKASLDLDFGANVDGEDTL